MAGFEIVSEISTRETDFDGTRHEFPQSIKVRTYARSPSGKFWVGRGWSKVKVTGTYVKYQ